MPRRIITVAVLIVAFSVSIFNRKSDASDWIGIYARIDRVVLEPNADNPERIQIWGAFALASKENRNNYDPARRGYLYYSLRSGKEQICRKEWADLKAKAGTGEIIGFGGRDIPIGRIRKADDKATDPDVYPVGFGLVKMSDRGSNYPPIVELKALSREQR